MTNTLIFRCGLALGLTVSLLSFAGCDTLFKPSAKAKSYQLRFQLDAALAGSSIQVDVIGANAVSDLPKLESYSINDYWKPGDPLRRDALKAVIAFGQGKDQIQTFSIDNEIWSTWLKTGATYLVIIADLPGGSFSDRTGNADPRRLILPLDRREWESKTTEIQILIQESGMRLLTRKRAK